MAEKLRAAMERLGRHLESSPLGILEWDADFRLLYWSPTAERIFGWKAEEVLGKHWGEWRLIHEEDLSLVEDIGSSVHAGQPKIIRNRNYTKDGRVIHCEWYNSAVVAENGETSYILSLVQDVTEAAHAHQALERSQERLDMVVEGADLGLWEWELATGQGSLNERWRELLGIPPNAYDRDPTSWRELIHPDDRERVQHALEAHLAGKTPQYEAEYRMRFADGEWRWVMSRGKVIERSPDGTPLRAAGTMLDIHHRKLLELQLRHAQRMESIGQLAGGIAHDFNNLLLVILSHTNFALTAVREDGDPRDDLAQIRHAAQRAAELTSQLLTLGRRAPMQLCAIDLNDRVRGLLRMLRRIIREDVEIDFIPAHDLPMINGDTAQIDQVLMNLCVNARDAMPEGGRLTIETETVVINGEYVRRHPWANPGRYVLLTVTDTGVGIPAEQQTRIFEPFFTTKSTGQGTGLGLAIVHSIVEQHDGMIHVYSEDGHGTTFKLYLPVATRLASAIGTKLDGPVPRGKETVLVAEDDPLVRSLVQRVLENAGYTVLAASDGLEAVQLFSHAAESIDAVLIDAVMPKLNGREVYTRIRAVREVPVMFTSGYSATALPPDFLQEHQLELLPKPYHPDVLLRKVRALLDGGG